LKRFREFIARKGRLKGRGAVKPKQLVPEQLDHEIQTEQSDDYNLAAVAIRREMSLSEKLDRMSDLARYITKVEDADVIVTAIWIKPEV
jgi:hypothetical protein